MCVFHSYYKAKKIYIISLLWIRSESPSEPGKWKLRVKLGGRNSPSIQSNSRRVPEHKFILYPRMQLWYLSYIGRKRSGVVFKYLKGAWGEIFSFWFFSQISFPHGPEYPIGDSKNFMKIRKYI